MKGIDKIFAGEVLVRSLQNQIALFDERETFDLYRIVTGYDPILGGVIYMKQNDDDRLLDVIDAISKIGNKIDNAHSMNLLIDDVKGISSSKRFGDCVIGFLEQQVDKLKKNVDNSSKNISFEFWKQFQMSEMENKFVQLAIAMESIKELREFFQIFFDIISDIDDEEDDDNDENALVKVLIIVLDIKPEPISEILEGPIGMERAYLKPFLSLDTGVSYLLELYEDAM